MLWLLFLLPFTLARRLTNDGFIESFRLSTMSQQFRIKQQHREAIEMRMDLLTLGYKTDPIKWQPFVDNFALTSYLMNVSFDKLRERAVAELEKGRFEFVLPKSQDGARAMLCSCATTFTSCRVSKR